MTTYLAFSAGTVALVRSEDVAQRFDKLWTLGLLSFEGLLCQGIVIIRSR